mmetsp:Transcript_7523/g.31135  ORF Transcript_7523/g.31135 Transcript_7523/m.31135 type:complete len:237 (+) Transcript_7523:249-959(+)
MGGDKTRKARHDTRRDRTRPHRGRGCLVTAAADRIRAAARSRYISAGPTSLRSVRRQQAQPPAPSGALPLAGPPARPSLTSTMFARPSREAGLPAAAALPPVAPGSAAARLRKSCLTLRPALAEVSMNMMFSSLALASPSSLATWRRSARSVLLPTSMMTTSSPRSARMSSIHLAVLTYEARFVVSYTTTATELSRMYDGMRLRNRSWPAVSHSWSRTVRSSRYIVLERKSMPIVA